MNWVVKPLVEIADFRLGKMLDEKKNRGELRPYLANLNVRWGEFDLTDLREMRFEHDELERYGLQYGDIVMCEGGEPGRCAIWKDQTPEMMIQKALHRIRPNAEFDNRFLYYSFLYLGKRGEFNRYLTGATIKHLPREKLAKVEIAFPSLSVQCRIADYLSAYDDLIENNRRRMALLEESARLLYREWFVRLRFPGYEHTRIVDGVPEGWERKALTELTCFLKRGITPNYNDEAEGLVINQKCIRYGRVNVELARRQSKEVKPERQLQPGDVLVNSTGEGTLGRVAQLKVPMPMTTVDTHVTIVRPRPDIPHHYFGLAVMEWEPRFSTMGKGATNQTELSPAAIGNTEILLPPKLLLEEFDFIVGPFYEQVSNLVSQNQKLRTARDLLLPRLMSGEIEV